MSWVVVQFIIKAQDNMPHEMRNSNEWKELLPLAAGTGRDKELGRLKVLSDCTWDLMKHYQPIADEKGFGDEWTAMTTERSQRLSIPMLELLKNHGLKETNMHEHVDCGDIDVNIDR